MDPMENGLFDIPDYDGIDDEAFPPLPPPHSPGRGGKEEGDPFADGEEDGDVSKLPEVPAAKKRVVKRPQPKLDSQRLVSERGLPALRTLFDNVCFKGKGHEASDLQLLMQKMENWAHRLYPKLQFEDFIDKVEKLGNKKEVQTCLKRIRLDMPLTHEDFMGKDGEEEAVPELQVFGEPELFSRAIFPDDVQGPVHSTPAPSAPSAPAAPSPAAPSLTEEQRCRMELNRQRALEKRLARQQQQQEQQETDPPDSQTVETPPDPQTVDTPPDPQTVDTPPDSQTVDTPTSADEPASVSSANILDGSEDQVEPAEDSDPEPVGSSTQRPGRPADLDSEPSAESGQPEGEGETPPQPV